MRIYKGNKIGSQIRRPSGKEKTAPAADTPNARK
jgi:hypothetical protein